MRIGAQHFGKVGNGGEETLVGFAFCLPVRFIVGFGRRLRARRRFPDAGDRAGFYLDRGQRTRLRRSLLCRR